MVGVRDLTLTYTDGVETSESAQDSKPVSCLLWWLCSELAKDSSTDRH